jgi:diphosphomevalonate decarboxylase
MACLASLLAQLLNHHFSKKLNNFQISNIARQLSGSACRSIFDGFVSWGQCDYLPDSHDDFAVEIDRNKIHEDFKHIHNYILVVDSNEKKISSRRGHELMKAHPYAEARYKSARLHHRLILESIFGGDWDMFGDTVEAEALELHAMMMTSFPGYFLLDPKALEYIQKIRKFRTLKDIPLYFTLDAGTNLHCIFPHEFLAECQQFLDSLTQNDKHVFIIKDWINLEDGQ